MPGAHLIFTSNAETALGGRVRCVGTHTYLPCEKSAVFCQLLRMEPCWRLLPSQRATVKIPPDILTRRRASPRTVSNCVLYFMVWTCGYCKQVFSSPLMVAMAPILIFPHPP